MLFSDDDGPYTLGFRFRADFDLRITSLGAFDHLGDGLATTHIVAIWPVDGNAPLESVMIAAGTRAPLLGAFRYAAVSNLILSANTDYIVGASDFYGSGADIYPWMPTVFSTSPGIHFLGARESSYELAGLHFPGDEYNPGAPLAVNFQFVPVPRLVIRRTDAAELALSWRTNAPSFHLESAEGLPAATWNAVTGVPTVLGDSFVLPLPSTGGQQYFRLTSE